MPGPTPLTRRAPGWPNDGRDGEHAAGEALVDDGGAGGSAVVEAEAHRVKEHDEVKGAERLAV